MVQFLKFKHCKSMKKSLEKFKNQMLTREQMKSVKGGDYSCDKAPVSEVRFLMDANGWSESKAIDVWKTGCKYAATSTKLN
jgi:hypothetical protein